MTSSGTEREALSILQDRIAILLPEEYQDSYEELQATPMGSAGLKFDADGKVAWGDIWASFCDLAIAGGPPHKGTLLEPAAPVQIDAQPERYAEVTREICRGITLAANLAAAPSATPGWIRVTCYSDTMAGWLLRAITMENVAVWSDGGALYLPAGPGYRLEKEIKNVITVIAKTSHYWLGHMPPIQRRAIANLFGELGDETPLVEAASPDDAAVDALQRTSAKLAERIEQQTHLRRSDHRYPNWLGVACPSVPAAIWLTRALVATNVLARREGTSLFVPVNPLTDPDGDTVSGVMSSTHRLAVASQESWR